MKVAVVRDGATPSAGLTRLPSRAILSGIYRQLLAHLGPQHWWPAKTPFEVVVGAILTQHTAWTNVERAIGALRQRGLLTPQALARLPVGRLARLIRPAGYFNVKAKRLKAFLSFLFRDYGGRLTALWNEEAATLRRALLTVPGIGPETADSILLYAGGIPVFVVDAYTKRILARHGLVAPTAGYDEIQRLFMDRLPRHAGLYNEFHALFVRVGKEWCRGVPRCEQCPLRYLFKPLSAPAGARASAGRRTARTTGSRRRGSSPGRPASGRPT